MKFSDLLSPLRRQFRLVFLIWLSLVLCLGLGLSQLPITQKTTIYFSLVPQLNENVTTLDPAEGTLKMAEAIAGWAQSPGFREILLKQAGVEIPEFKKKISARRQNNFNVFWTLKLTGKEEAAAQSKITFVLVSQIESRLASLSEGSALGFSMTQPEIFTEAKQIPTLWRWLVALFLASMIAGFYPFIREILTGRLSFVSQLDDLFPSSPILQIPAHPSEHETQLLESFLMGFQQPKLVGTFGMATDFFDLVDRLKLKLETETPILLIRKGDTSLLELENCLALYGDGVPVVVFER